MPKIASYFLLLINMPETYLSIPFLIETQINFSFTPVVNVIN